MLWWIEDPVLRAGSSPDMNLIRELRENERLATVISLVDDAEHPPGYAPEELAEIGVARYSIPVPSFTAPTFDQLRRFIRIVEEVSPEGQILVHCTDGLRTTATFAAAWLMHSGLSLGGALAKLREDYPLAVEDGEHKRALERYAQLR